MLANKQNPIKGQENENEQTSKEVEERTQCSRIQLGESGACDDDGSFIKH